MFVKLYRYITGYLVIKLLGTETERFLNLCANRGIFLWRLKCVGGTYYAQVMVKDYKRMHPAVRKTGVRPVIVGRRGLPFFLHRNRKRGLFAAGFLLFFCLIIRLSFYIWDISVLGTYSHTPEQIIRFLQENDIYTGKSKKEVDCPEIEALLRGAYEDVGWVSAEIKGTRLIIKISETNIPEKNETATGPQHIVAEKDGIVKSIVVRSGTPVVTRGDVVKKGDLLISGIVEVIGDGEEVIEKQAVAADGDVCLATFYRYEDQIELSHTEKIYTGESVTGIGLYSGEKKIFSFLPSYSYEKYDIISQDTPIAITADLVLPLKFSTVKVYEYYEQRMMYTEEEAAALLNARLTRYLENLIGKGVLITENNVKIDISGKTGKAAGDIRVEEQAWDYLAVNDDEWRNIETDEHSGNDD